MQAHKNWFCPLLVKDFLVSREKPRFDSKVRSFSIAFHRYWVHHLTLFNAHTAIHAEVSAVQAFGAFFTSETSRMPVSSLGVLFIFVKKHGLVAFLASIATTVLWRHFDGSSLFICSKAKTE